jgi:glutathione S-transferase
MGPMFGQVGYFHKFAGREIEDKRPLHRYRDEAKRILAVIEGRLVERSWIIGDDYTIADISMLGWVRNLIGFYDAGELVGFSGLKHVPAWLERGLCAARRSTRAQCAEARVAHHRNYRPRVVQRRSRRDRRGAYCVRVSSRPSCHWRADRRPKLAGVS